jgi:very-short-patch-repair endonuclease
VLGPDGYPLYYLDMGWEDITLAVEYDGVQHADQIGYDIVRNEYIASAGWTTVKVAAGHRRASIIGRVQQAWDRLTSPLALR